MFSQSDQICGIVELFYRREEAFETTTSQEKTQMGKKCRRTWHLVYNPKILLKLIVYTYSNEGFIQSAQ